MVSGTIITRPLPTIEPVALPKGRKPLFQDDGVRDVWGLGSSKSTLLPPILFRSPHRGRTGVRLHDVLHLGYHSLGSCIADAFDPIKMFWDEESVLLNIQCSGFPAIADVNVLLPVQTLNEQGEITWLTTRADLAFHIAHAFERAVMACASVDLEKTGSLPQLPFDETTFGRLHLVGLHNVSGTIYRAEVQVDGFNIQRH